MDSSYCNGFFLLFLTLRKANLRFRVQDISFSFYLSVSFDWCRDKMNNLCALVRTRHQRLNCCVRGIWDNTGARSSPDEWSLITLSTVKGSCTLNESESEHESDITLRWLVADLFRLLSPTWPSVENLTKAWSSAVQCFCQSDSCWLI